ncbi:cAMP phosphodiesterases class-II-domain-containing protein [Pholiota molesta]|nr:cAMP phosphodiesterases class-II-domain-containing protein [Pholiota molesta]
MLNSPVFDLFVVGSGGGPDETNLSAYLLKLHTAQWEDGIVALEAGSGQGTLARLLRRDPCAGSAGKVYSASDIYSFVRCFLLTHAHLDHINSLVVSAGSLRGPRKRVYGLKQTLQDLELVFSDRIWPNLASWKEEDDVVKLLYSTTVQFCRLFVRHDLSHREFLFFGDVEPDSLAEKPLTIDIWRVSAPKIPETLSTIFIECSYPSGREDDVLFGHLSPEHLADELTSLATELSDTGIRKRPVRKRQKRNSLTPDELKDALAGVRVYVMHCKDDMNFTSERHIRDVIVEQVRQIVEEKGLGAKVLAVEQGAHIIWQTIESVSDFPNKHIQPNSETLGM